jgi:hypothetical protein
MSDTEAQQEWSDGRSPADEWEAQTVFLGEESDDRSSVRVTAGGSDRCISTIQASSLTCSDTLLSWLLASKRRHYSD